MGNQTFRTLYDEAKDHEKQANLTGLITRRREYVYSKWLYNSQLLS